MREVQILRWCDACTQLAFPRRNVAEGSSLYILGDPERGDTATVEFDSCGQCRKEASAEDFLTMVADVGRPVKDIYRPKARTVAKSETTATDPPITDPPRIRRLRRYKCFISQCERSFTAVSDAHDHMWEAHALDTRNRLYSEGERCPLCGGENKSKGAFRAHLIYAHPASATMFNVYHAANEQGDIHGLVAAAIERCRP